METPALTLAYRLRAIRRQHRLSQTQLADLAGVSLPSISRFERGKETIRLDVLSKILACLGYELDIRPNFGRT